jgi:PAS domain S-box-containing protein
MRVSRRIVVVFVVVAVLVAVGLAASFWIFGQIQESARLRTQTASVVDTADDVLSAVADIETGARGYALTGDESFLEPYTTGTAVLEDRMAALRRVAAGGLASADVETLGPLVDAKLANASRGVALYRSGDTTGAIALVAAGEGKRLMESVRERIASIKQIERGGLAQRETAFDANVRLMLVLMIALSVVALLAALVFAYVIFRQTRQELENQAHRETEQLLAVQESANEQLQLANSALVVSEDKLAVTLNSIGDAVIATDSDGLVALMNPLAEQLTGWSRGEAVGRPIDEVLRIVNEETRAPATNPVPATLTLGTIHGLANHTIVIARDGSECPIADSCAPIRDGAGSVVGAVLVFRDVTERNRLDRVLSEQNAELERARSMADEANLAKSDFLSSMSHELRSPLNAILGFAQLMASDSPAPSPAQLASIDQILQAGWHLLKLIGEILDLSKIESGQVPLSLEPVPLAAVLRECRGMMGPQAQERGIGLVFPERDIDWFVRADQTRITQVLVNLLTNAIKYNVEGGTVEVDAVESAPGRIRLSVRDTGRGLDALQLTQLFQAFNRLGQEAGGQEGTGIGLVVAKRLVELMGGTIGVESTVGTGSVFWFELASVDGPRIQPGPTATATIAQDRARGEGAHTVLYVEDNPANLSLVEQIIARQPDIELLTATTGLSGIEIARTSLPDVVLMDINLPDISGVEALRILRSDPTTAHIPVVAVSANAMPRDIKKGIEAGFFRYVTKPIRVAEFVDTLDAALAYASSGDAAKQ